MRFLYCDHCKKDMRDESLYLRKFASFMNVGSWRDWCWVMKANERHIEVLAMRITIFVVSIGGSRGLVAGVTGMCCMLFRSVRRVLRWQLSGV